MSTKNYMVREAKIVYVNIGKRSAEKKALETPEDTCKYVLDSGIIEDDEKEHLVVILLDTKLNPKGIQLVSLGTVNETIAHPRDIFRPAILSGAYALLVAHNHPSGDPSPSGADIEMTRRLRDAAELLQIVLLDHIIVGKAKNDEAGFPVNKGYYSFKEAGYL